MLDAGIDKRMLLAALIAQVEAKIEELRAGYGAAREAVLSTPHVMKSKREVFGQESAYLANALALNIQEREHGAPGAAGGASAGDGRDRAALGVPRGCGRTGWRRRGALLHPSGVRGDGVAGGGSGHRGRVVTPATHRQSPPGQVGR